jgi:hypothetical protein
MTEDRQNKEALLAHFRAMRADLLDAIAGLTDEQMTERTLDGWSVKDHLAHIAFWDDLRADEVIRISAGQGSAWRLTSEEDEAINVIATRARWDLPLPQVLYEFETSKRRFMDALERATPEGLDASRYGEAGLVSEHEAEHTGWIRRWRGERGY